MSAIAARQRDAMSQQLLADRFDVVVVGGGITGAGVALDAASRGLRTAIVDKGDWASGTSSKSSKLIHGGLRYLQQKEYRLVYENLRERQRLLQNAPHLVSVMPFLIPLFGKGGVVSKTVAKGYSTALSLYDFTGGLRIGKRHERLSVAQTIAHMGGLAGDRVVAGFLYYDAQADDARLTLSVIRTAIDHGAVALNYCGVEALSKTAAGQIDGVVLEDGNTVRARCVVNAAGIWGEQIMQMDGTVSHHLRPAKGIHITVPAAKIRADIAAVVPVRKDRRSVFVVPARDAPGELIYVGTTDTEYQGPLDDPVCTADDVQYLLDAMNSWLAEPLTSDDVVGTWAGLRPLLEGARSDRTADLSRRHAVVTSPSGLVSILGGKLTTYRAMAEDTVDAVVGQLGERKRRCRTRKLALRGAAGLASLQAPGTGRRFGFDDAQFAVLLGRHGSEALAIADLVRGDSSLAEPLVPGLGYLRAEAVHAVRHEQARTLTDVLTRRTRALLYARDASDAVAGDVAALIAPELSWSPAEQDRQVAWFRAAVSRELRSEHAGLAQPAGSAATP